MIIKPNIPPPIAKNNRPNNTMPVPTSRLVKFKLFPNKRSQKLLTDYKIPNIVHKSFMRIAKILSRAIWVKNNPL